MRHAWSNRRIKPRLRRDFLSRLGIEARLHTCLLGELYICTRASLQGTTNVTQKTGVSNIIPPPLVWDSPFQLKAVRGFFYATHELLPRGTGPPPLFKIRSDLTGQKIFHAGFGGLFDKILHVRSIMECHASVFVASVSFPLIDGATLFSSFASQIFHHACR